MHRPPAVALFIVLATTLAALATLPGCGSPRPQRPAPLPPDYSRALAPGAAALRLVPPDQWPDLTPVVAQMDDPAFHEAAARSVKWFGYPSTPRYFPGSGTQPVPHAHAWASTYALQQIATLPREARLDRLRADFDLYTSVGWDGRGTVLFTGYFSPVFQASRVRGGAFNHPLYAKPDDLLVNPDNGEVLGRQTATGVTPYPTRQQIDANPAALGLQPLVFLSQPLDAYLIHVNGSARLALTDGTTMHVGYAGTNGAQYTSIGRALAEAGAIDPDRVSLATIRAYFRDHPDQLSRYLNLNDRYVFFAEYDGTDWPAGSLGLKVTAFRSLATDKTIFPRGVGVIVDTTLPTPTGGTQPFRQLMLDQDTGGAIRAPGRADIYLGVGRGAEALAGQQAAEGRLYYLLLKRDAAPAWLNRARADANQD